eukprot:2559492-Prymnesium_polylepis.1
MEVPLRVGRVSGAQGAAKAASCHKGGAQVAVGRRRGGRAGHVPHYLRRPAARRLVGAGGHAPRRAPSARVGPRAIRLAGLRCGRTRAAAAAVRRVVGAHSCAWRRATVLSSARPAVQVRLLSFENTVKLASRLEAESAVRLSETYEYTESDYMSLKCAIVEEWCGWGVVHCCRRRTSTPSRTA